MIRRLLSSGLLSLCLVLTGLAATMAETRMAAAGGFCGTGHPEILLDGAGVPLLDAAGNAVAAPDCPLCTLAAGPSSAEAHVSEAPARLIGTITALAAPFLPAAAARSENPARGPPAPV